MGYSQVHFLILEAEGYKITLRALHLLCTRLGLTRRIYDPVNRQLQEEEAAKGLLEGIGKGTIKGYGRELLYSHIRGCGYNIPRDRLFAIYHHHVCIPLSHLLATLLSCK
ncbi:uncharacterized protein ASPGLDRAFT_44896 [Aspergillus glaucus CBS 516.65]|uniref:Uncharacterized protein n=1 Tax=Aspergillus glaucus CBS 516.65 TaxID=1160497 RepID=A0A1L9VPS3_ASPGL|nr:hypothetical protein ASPGLDRAFT_44896 [Aspergillus glaucus CBS 516.65]OJJ85923.1 hypothetical protein ASPGLDRAFT_44896 [Aspergillus glaucus CBS 516.65]